MCCPQEADSGFLCNIKKIFTGMKRCQSPCKDKVYTYSMSQLKCIEKEISILEDETYCHEATIRDALCCDCVTDCEYLRCALNSIMDKLECIRCDLQCAHECYDPVRDRCENELICQLMDRTRCLEMLVSDLCQQVCLLECQGNCWSASGKCGRRCRPGCRSPCFSLKGVCDPCIPDPCPPVGPSNCNPCGPCGPSSCGPSSCGPSPCGPSCGPSGCGPSGCGPSRRGCGPAPCGPSGGPCGPCGPPYPRPTCAIDCRKPCCRPDCGPRCKPGCRKPCCYKPSPCGPGCTKPCCKPRRWDRC